MIVRRAEAQDSAAISQLAQMFATSFAVEEAAFERSFAELLTHPEGLLAVADEDGVVGYLLGFEHLTFFANGRVAWVEEIMVSEQHRRSGIGRRLMEAFEAWAQERDVKIIALATRRAAGFYAALGYKESASYFRKVLVRSDMGEAVSD